MKIEGRPGPTRLVVVDWGIGGLDALAGLAQALPQAELIYRSDSGFTPYGVVAPDQLAERVRRVAVQALGVVREGDRLVIACNAASTIIERLELGVPVHGVIAPGVALLAAAASSGSTRLAVLGGQRTIASGVHATLLRALGCELELESLVSQPLSAHVEAGRLAGAVLMADLQLRSSAGLDRDERCPGDLVTAARLAFGFKLDPRQVQLFRAD